MHPILAATAQVKCLEGNTCDTQLPKIGATTANLQIILQFLFGILTALAVLFIVIGGLKYVMSQGDPNETGKAKQTILYAVIGLVIAVSAEAIVSFVLGSL